LPFAIHTTPFAAVEEGEEAIPLVDLTRAPGRTQPLDRERERQRESDKHNQKVEEIEDCPPRCKNLSCRAYINPNVLWCAQDNGRTWTCNLCLTAGNRVPDWYYAPLDPITGLRIDRNYRPELTRGSVDFVVGEEYCDAPPKVNLNVCMSF
jgi:hypothetical protein